jgi:TatA/E family protein of Tat protein translocase
MFGVGYQELLIVLVIMLILFGASQVPKLARALGEGVRELRDGLKASKEVLNDKDRG